MINSNADTIELKGDPAEIIYETASILTRVVAQVAKESGFPPEEILADIMIGYQYNTLVNSGMTSEEAWAIAGPKEDDKES